jgi:hypothetical protein
MNGLSQHRRRVLAVSVVILLCARSWYGLLGMALTFCAMGLLHVVSLIWPRSRPWFFRQHGDASP